MVNTQYQYQYLQEARDNTQYQYQYCQDAKVNTQYQYQYRAQGQYLNTNTRYCWPLIYIYTQTRYHEEEGEKITHWTTL